MNMESLSKNWLTEKNIDFEYKKYLLLAYLSKVSEQFTENKLYPNLSQLIDHYRSLLRIKSGKKELYDQFAERMTSADLKNFKVFYEKMVEDSLLMKEIEATIDYSIPKFEQYLSEGKEIYEFIESQLEVFPVGIVPLNTDEGYFFLKNSKRADTSVFEYRITLYNSADEQLRAINTEFICNYKESALHTFEYIKTELIKYHKKLPNPATYAIESKLVIPFQETFLPIAKRIIVKLVA